MNKADLKHRTMRFGLEMIRLAEALAKGRTEDVIGRQMVRSGTSVGANYRAACRAKSTADFISKMGTVEEETDESMYWMELLVKAGVVGSEKVRPLLQEANGFWRSRLLPSRQQKDRVMRNPHSAIRNRAGYGQKR